MDFRISKRINFYFLLAVAVFAGFLLFGKDFPENPKVMNNYNGQISGDSEKELSFSTPPAENASLTENIWQIKPSGEVSDPPGQLVRHLFNIESVPSAKAAAFSLDGRELWVTSLLNAKRGIIVFDAQSGLKIKDINLADGGGVELVFSGDGSKVYVSQMETAKVFEIDAKTKEVLRVFETGSTWTKILELSPDGSSVFASNWVGNDISEIDLQAGKLARILPAVKTPRGIYPTSDGKYLYVAGFDSGELQKIDLATGRGAIIYKSGGALRHMAADPERGVLFVSEMAQGVILEVSLTNDSVRKFAETDINPNTIVLSPDKKILFVSCRGRNYSADNYSIPGPEWGSLLLFDAQTGKMLDAIVGGNQPTALAVSPDGKKLAFSDFLDARLEVFEIPSYENLLAGNGGRSAAYKKDLQK